MIIIYYIFFISLGVRPYKCNLCEKSFTQRCSLESHCLKVHGVAHNYEYKQRRSKVCTYIVDIRVTKVVMIQCDLLTQSRHIPIGKFHANNFLSCHKLQISDFHCQFSMSKIIQIFPLFFIE